MTDFLQNGNSFETTINRGILSTRSRRLDSLVRAIHNFQANQTHANLLEIDNCWNEWREQDPKEFANRFKRYEWDMQEEIDRLGGYHWGFPRIVDESSHPPYQPWLWNDWERFLLSTNCYAYACDDPFDHPMHQKPQPGQLGGSNQGQLPMENWAVRYAVQQDDLARSSSLIPVVRLADEGVGNRIFNQPGYYLIALVVARGVDYHWLRQDNNGKWSHKPGHTRATNLDARGNVIHDPRICNMYYGPNLNYEFETFYYAPKGGVRTGKLGHLP